jgi:high-affinity nickel-transport protein
VSNVFSRGEWLRLALLVAAVAALHVVGWGLFLWYSRQYPALAGLGVLAYTFGLRHAFDADHIAAIDNTTRAMLQQGKRPLAVGFFFSLGHSTIVFSLAAVLAVAATAAAAHVTQLQHYGGYVSIGVSGTFLWVIGVLNLLVLVDIVRIVRSGGDSDRLERRLLDRGFLNRFFLGRLFRLVSRSWHMYLLGILFGLGFETATEVALLSASAGLASHDVPVLAVLSLPIVFAAGMTLMDTADGAFMSHAYSWALSNPLRKAYYNIAVTALSVTVALGVGSLQLLHVAGVSLDLGRVGYAVVGLFVLVWAASALAWWRRSGPSEALPEPGL